VLKPNPANWANKMDNDNNIRVKPFSSGLKAWEEKMIVRKPKNAPK
jgi:hypothetical protein